MQNIGFELSPFQKRLWLLMEEGFSLNNFISLRISGVLDLNTLNAALTKVIDRHEIIRTNYLSKANIAFPVQTITRFNTTALEYLDFTLTDKTEHRNEVKNLLHRLVFQTFQYQSDFLLKAVLVKLDDEKHVLAFCMPSLSSDIKSLENIVREVMELYVDLSAEAEDDVFQFVQYSEWHNDLMKEHDEEAKNFWSKQTFFDHLNIKLPLEIEARSKSNIESINCPLRNDLVEKLRYFSEKYKCTFPVLLLSCWKAYIWRLLDCPQDVVIGYIDDGRTYEPFFKINGLLARTLPLQSQLAIGHTIKDLANKLSEEIETIKGWQDYFSWEVYDKLTSPSANVPFFPICFEYNSLLGATLGNSQISYEIDKIYSVCDVFKLKLCCNEYQKGVEFDLYYLSSFFESHAIECIRDQFLGFLEEFVNQSDQPLYDLLKTSSQEENKILTTFNSNSKFLFPNKIIEEFEKQVSGSGGNIALAGIDELSYEALNSKANQLASLLIQNYGVCKGDIVAIFLPRSVNLIISILGILKAGAAYLPIDISFPEQRLNFILEDSKAKLLILEKEKIVNIPQKTELLKIDSDLNCIKDKNADNPLIDIQGKDLAYIIYTSGTTGNPKGVMIPHQSLMNYVQWFRSSYKISETDSSMLLSSVAFDLCYTSLWTSLLSGGTLYLLKESKFIDPEDLLKILVQQKITYLKLTPSHFKMLVTAASFKEDVRNLSLRLIVLGGEEIKIEDLETYFTFRPEVIFVNHYGPTETTIGTLTHKIGYEDLARFKAKPIIGRPIHNNRVYVLNENFQLSPIGISGQIGVCGEGVANGYLNREELSKEKFVSYLSEEGDLMYLTGDQGRWLADGTIEFLGRNDNQVKVRGYRIELKEIEVALESHPDIEEAVALVGHPGEIELRCYFVGTDKLSITNLKTYMEGRLPGYMLPSHWIRVDRIPLTGNGKVDRTKLLSLESPSERAFYGHRNEIEEILTKIWEEVMSGRSIGIKDDFFELGGHSLKAVQIVSRIYKELEIKIELKHIFENPTIERLAELINYTQKKSFTTISAIEEQEYYGLSCAQKRLWILDQLEEGFNAYNMVSAYSLEGNLDEEAFEKAFKAIVQRHESLRTVFVAINGEPKQIILNEKLFNFKLDYLELEAQDLDKNIDLIAKEEAYRSFDLKTGPLLRAKLIRNKNGNYVFLFTIHHIISDGWSIKVLIKEIVELYYIYKEGKSNDLLPLNIQYKDYAAWHNNELNQKNINKHKQFWINQFKGEIPILDFPTDFVRPSVKTYNGDSIQFVFNKNVSKGIKDISKRYDATVFMTLIAAVKALLNRYTGQEDIIIGVPIAERTNQILENQIGLYLNNISLRTRFRAEENFDVFLSEVKRGLLDAYEHQIYPFDMLVEDLKIKRDMSRSPLFDVVILKNSDYGEEDQSLEGISVEERDSGFRVSTIDLRIVFNEGDQYITGVIDFNTDLFIRKSIVDFSENLQKLIEAIIEDNTIKICDINLGFKSSYTKQELSTKFNF